MSSNKKAKLKFNFIIICIIGFIVSIFFEFYFISYFPYDYFMLFGIGIIMCIFGYLSIDGVLEIINQTMEKRNEQNEIMIKASKAIYLTTKKIALNSSHSIQAPLESPKDINALIDDLSQANERLAKEVENAVSLQPLVQKNRSIVNNAREIIDDSHEQPLSPLEVEKDLKLDETIVETDFETITQPEAIDSMMEREVSDTDSAISDPVAISEETIDAIGSILEEENSAKMETISEAADMPEVVSDSLTEASKTADTSEAVSDSLTEASKTVDTSEAVSDSLTEALKTAETVSVSSAEASKTADMPEAVSDGLTELLKTTEAVSDSFTEIDEFSENISDILSEVKETASNIINNSIDDLNKAAAYNETAEPAANISEAETPSEQNIPEVPDNTSMNKAPAESENTNKPLTADEIAALFANL